MKLVKIGSAFLLVMLVFISASAYAVSEPIQGEEISLKNMTEFITDLDSFSLRSVSCEDIIYDALKNHTESLDISDYNLDYYAVRDIIQNVIYKYPDTYAFDGWSYYYDQNTGYVTRILLYYGDDIVTAQNKIRLYNAFKKMAFADIRSSMTELEKVIVIHDYIVAHIDYDAENPNFNAVDMAITGNGVCQAYTQMFYDCCMDLGISCGLTYSGNHIWNIVKIDNKWYNIDLTFDDPIGSLMGNVSHTYAVLSSGALLALEPTRTDATNQSVCTDTYYDSVPWKKAYFSYVVPYNGKLYYVGGSSLQEYNQTTKRVTELAQYTGFLKFGSDPTVYAPAGVGIYGGVLYYTQYTYTGYDENTDHYLFQSRIKSINLATNTSATVRSLSGTDLYHSLMIENGVISCAAGKLTQVIDDEGERARMDGVYIDEPIDVGHTNSFVGDMAAIYGNIVIIGANSSEDNMKLIFTGDFGVSIDEFTFPKGYLNHSVAIPSGSTKAFLWAPGLKPVCGSVDIE